AAIGAFALEYGAGVVQPVRAHVQCGIAPGKKCAVVPDDAIEPVIGLLGHDCLRTGLLCGKHALPQSMFACRSRYAFASGPNTRYGSVAPQERTGRAPL